MNRYQSRPVEVEAIELKAHGDFTRAVAWANENGRRAFSRTFEDGVCVINAVRSNDTWSEGLTGDFFVREGEEFSIYPRTAFLVKFDLISEPQSEGTSKSYSVGRPGKSSGKVTGAVAAIP